MTLSIALQSGWQPGRNGCVVGARGTLTVAHKILPLLQSYPFPYHRLYTYSLITKPDAPTQTASQTAEEAVRKLSHCHNVLKTTTPKSIWQSPAWCASSHNNSYNTSGHPGGHTVLHHSQEMSQPSLCLTLSLPGIQHSFQVCTNSCSTVKKSPAAPYMGELTTYTQGNLPAITMQPLSTYVNEDTSYLSRR